MIYKADIFLFFACFPLLDLCLSSRRILMFDLATYPAISLKFIEIQFNDNYEHHESRQEIHE